MAKSKSFYGLRKGSTKSHTYSVLRGQQVTKDRVTDVVNPKTVNQMQQRIPFANTIKFYKHATQSLFKFAYEDKRRFESDYNAFVRHNIARSASVSPDNYANIKYPALGAWQLTQGTLEVPAYEVRNNKLYLVTNQLGANTETVGKLSEDILEKYKSLAVGDIVTFVVYHSALNNQGVIDLDFAPYMQIVQIIINPDDDTDLHDIGLDYVQSLDDCMSMPITPENHACCGAVIFSRNTPKGLKVSTAVVAMDPIYKAYYLDNTSHAQRLNDAKQWGASDEAILEGGIAGDPVLVRGTFTVEGGNVFTNPNEPRLVTFSSGIKLSTNDSVKINGYVATPDAINFIVTIGDNKIYLGNTTYPQKPKDNYLRYSTVRVGSTFTVNTIEVNDVVYTYTE